MASSSSLSLVGMPEDVLREILAHLLLDTPRVVRRAAILETCKLIHGLGTPLLYRVVELNRSQSIKTFARQWRGLFESDGILARPRREGAFVRELRIGGEIDAEEDGSYSDDLKGLDIGELNLPLVSTFVLEDGYLPLYRNPRKINLLAQLPGLKIIHIRGSVRDDDGVMPILVPQRGSPADYIDRRLRRSALLSPTLDHLEKVVVSGQEAFGEMFFNHDFPYWAWTFDTMVIEIEDAGGGTMWNERTPSVFKLVQRCPLYGDGDQVFLAGVQKVQLRIPFRMEEDMRAYVKKSQEVTEFNVAQKRIIPLIVFVDEDGTERKLLEDSA